jgi:hypothetical protein
VHRCDRIDAASGFADANPVCRGYCYGVISKATSVYIIMLAIFGAGLWAILSFGSIMLHAPTDLAGKWELRPQEAPESSAAHTLAIDQSGKYFQIVLDNQHFPARQTQQEGITSPTSPDQVRVALAGGGNELVFSGAADADVFWLETRGTAPGSWRAVRVARAYPKHPADQPAVKPAAATRP